MNKEVKNISVAPMMDWTDRHCRYFLRLFSPNIKLYTEMITTGAIIHGNRDRFLKFNEIEHPVAIQLGGSNPLELAECAKIAQDYGYDEININCGCPSNRVQNGNFGASLMKSPEIVARSVEEMSKAVNIPITVKCRIGIDEEDERSFSRTFVKTVSESGCSRFIIHARKAYLKGLSPKENRDIPPLQYNIVKEIKENFPHLYIELNGGIKTLEEVNTLITEFDGIMIGREAYQNPFILSEIDQALCNKANIRTRASIARAMIPYIEEQTNTGEVSTISITRHILGLFKGQPGGALWRRYLSENAKSVMSPQILIENALEFTEQESLCKSGVNNI
jgi:tRNA-dihydrouridine synthase A